MIWIIGDFDYIPQELRGKQLRLLTRSELENLPYGIELTSVLGEKIIKRMNTFDPIVTRGGYTAFGFLVVDADHH